MNLIESIKEIAVGAGEIMKSASDIHPSEAKAGHANFVTRYDAMVQEYLEGRLSALLPEATFVAEEEGQEVFKEEDKTGFTFVIDPIDGTSNFMKGLRPSVTSIGLLKDGMPYIGVVYDPYSDSMFYAEKGHGAFLNGKRIMSSDSPLSESLVSMGTAPYYEEEVSRSAFLLGHYYLTHSIDIRRSGSAAFDICLVASGVTGMFYEPRLCLWDYAAGACILEEAGGKITDFHGDPIPFTGKSQVLAASRGVVEGGNYLPPSELTAF
ncbi:MAG: inositol monophosphatase [Blautia sp.]|nr:inositol monophosphatase [Blautia sp.]